jgi:hypothetical protein
VKDHGLVKVIGSPTAIETASAERDGWLNVIKLL